MRRKSWPTRLPTVVDRYFSVYWVTAPTPASVRMAIEAIVRSVRRSPSPCIHGAGHHVGCLDPITESNTIFSGHGSIRSVAPAIVIAINATANNGQYGRSSRDTPTTRELMACPARAPAPPLTTPRCRATGVEHAGRNGVVYRCRSGEP